jgi:hypothetical protein
MCGLTASFIVSHAVVRLSLPKPHAHLHEGSKKLGAHFINSTHGFDIKNFFKSPYNLLTLLINNITNLKILL